MNGRKQDTVVTIKFRNLYLELEGRYEPGEDMTHEYPGSPAEFDIWKINVDRVDIMELLDYDLITEMEHLAIDSIEGR